MKITQNIEYDESTNSVLFYNNDDWRKIAYIELCEKSDFIGIVTLNGIQLVKNRSDISTKIISKEEWNKLIHSFEEKPKDAILELAAHWRSKADSIISQLDFVNHYPDAPMREVKTLRKCATELEAAMKPDGLSAVIHMIKNENNGC